MPFIVILFIFMLYEDLLVRILRERSHKRASPGLLAEVWLAYLNLFPQHLYPFCWPNGVPVGLVDTFLYY